MSRANERPRVLSDTAAMTSCVESAERHDSIGHDIAFAFVVKDSGVKLCHEFQSMSLSARQFTLCREFCSVQRSVKMHDGARINSIRTSSVHRQWLRVPFHVLGSSAPVLDDTQQLLNLALAL